MFAQDSVVVTVENLAPKHSTFQTPLWIGFHDGSFDIYDRFEPAPLFFERISEDGATGEDDPYNTEFITGAFNAAFPQGVQDTMADDEQVMTGFEDNGLLEAPGAPLIPQPAGVIGTGERVSECFKLDRAIHRFFSYASMILPSNDAVVANGNPGEHPIYDGNDNFVAAPFTVDGSQILDAGTEKNTESEADAAFFRQEAPDTGTDQGGVVEIHPGFKKDGRILSADAFKNADFRLRGLQAVTDIYNSIRVNFFLIPDRLFFVSLLDASQEVGVDVYSKARGIGVALYNKSADTVQVAFKANGLSGDLTMAHLHVGAKGQNGPVVVDLGDGIVENKGGKAFAIATIKASDLVGPFADRKEPLEKLLAELVGKGIYFNLHTAKFPQGEIRGQVRVFSH